MGWRNTRRLSESRFLQRFLGAVDEAHGHVVKTEVCRASGGGGCGRWAVVCGPIGYRIRPWPPPSAVLGPWRSLTAQLILNRYPHADTLRFWWLCGSSGPGLFFVVPSRPRLASEFHSRGTCALQSSLPTCPPVQSVLRPLLSLLTFHSPLVA
mgnify:CR=1 FL=1